MRVAYRSIPAVVAGALLYLLSLPTTTPQAAAREVVPFNGGVQAGTIVVRTN